MTQTKIAIIGDYNPSSKSHLLLNQSLDWLKASYCFEYEWLDTAYVNEKGDDLLKDYQGIWSPPGSPFKNLDGSLKAIRYARENNIPHLGTCGGFQHTIIEFARNVLGLTGAQHEEYDNSSSVLIISKLACSLSGKTMSIQIDENSLAHQCYKNERVVEDYFCSFGINPEYRDILQESNLKISGVDQDNEIRIIEVPENNFFLATLFVPQTRATEQKPHPLIENFIIECVK